MGTTWRFLRHNKTVSRSLVLSIFSTWEKNFFPYILVGFLKLNEFTINLFAKEVPLVTFVCPVLTFDRNFVDSVFPFWLYSSEGTRRIRWNFFSHFQTFLSNWNLWCYIFMGYWKKDTILSCFLWKDNIFWRQLNSNPEPLSFWTNTQPFGQTGLWIHSETRTWHDKNIQSMFFDIVITWNRLRGSFYGFLKNIIDFMIGVIAKNIILRTHPGLDLIIYKSFTNFMFLFWHRPSIRICWILVNL